MPEFQSVQDATAQITSLYKVKSGGQLAANDFTDYGRIAYFLSAQRNQVISALDKVSLLMWTMDIFRDPTGGNQRFTTALVTLAKARGWEFQFHTMVVLMAAVEGEDYEQWARAGTFFKDDMDAKHGEHSHSLQWLAIAEWRQQLGLVRPADFLYRNIFDALPKVEGTKSLWSWLVDCFPTGIKGPGPFSDTFRSPQMLMKYLLDEAPEDMFLKQYLLRRYQRRNWFKADRDGKFTHRYAEVSGGATIKNYKEDKIKKNPAAWWNLVPGTEGVAYERNAPSALPGGVMPPKQRTPDAVYCHGRPGYL
jgi:hypothetical protein